MRHFDGRTGEIRKENVGSASVALFIAIDGGGEAMIQLNASGSDSGETGWEWFCENYSSGACWLLLGDHNSSTATKTKKYGENQYRAAENRCSG